MAHGVNEVRHQRRGMHHAVCRIQDWPLTSTVNRQLLFSKQRAVEHLEISDDRFEREGHDRNDHEETTDQQSSPKLGGRKATDSRKNRILDFSGAGISIRQLWICLQAEEKREVRFRFLWNHFFPAITSKPGRMRNKLVVATTSPWLRPRRICTCASVRMPISTGCNFALPSSIR